MKKNRKLRGLSLMMPLLSLTLLSSPFTAKADTNPLPEVVINPSMLDLMGQGVDGASTMMDQMRKSYNEVESTYNKLQDQYTEVQNFHTDLQNDLHGNYQYGDLFNDLHQFQWTAETWEKELKSTSGTSVSSSYQPLVSNYNATYPSVNTTTFEQGATQTSANMYTQGVAVNRTAMTESAYQFNDIDGRLKEIQDLSKKIDGASSTKEAMDLNSRITAEIAYIQTDMLRMQTVTNQQLAQVAAQNLSVQMQDSAFYASPDLPMEF